MATMTFSERVSEALFVLTPGFSESEPLSTRVERLNELRRAIQVFSPFLTEPVDLVEWVASDVVQANDYNPNSVAPPEMELLRLSIMAEARATGTEVA